MSCQEDTGSGMIVQSGRAWRQFSRVDLPHPMLPSFVIRKGAVT